MTRSSSGALSSTLMRPSSSLCSHRGIKQGKLIVISKTAAKQQRLCLRPLLWVHRDHLLTWPRHVSSHPNPQALTNGSPPRSARSPMEFDPLTLGPQAATSKRKSKNAAVQQAGTASRTLEEPDPAPEQNSPP